MDNTMKRTIDRQQKWSNISL